MDESGAADRNGDRATVSWIVASLFELPASDTPDEALLNAFRRLLLEQTQDELQREVALYLEARGPSLKSAIRLVEFATHGGHTTAGLKLVDRLIAHFDHDETLVDLRLRFLLGLRLWEELVCACDAALSRQIGSIQLAYRVTASLNRLVGEGEYDVAVLYRRALSVFSIIAADSRERPLWWARYYRTVGNAVSSLKFYRQLIEQSPKPSPYRPAALREGAELALSGDAWGRDAPFLLQAAEEGVALKAPWRARASAAALAHGLTIATLGPLARLPGTTVYSRVHDAVGSPESAFDYLIDRVLPTREAYKPSNALLMVGTSLAAGGMERIFANSYRALNASGAFERVTMALHHFEPSGPTAFYLPDSGADAAAISVLWSHETPDLPVSMLPERLARRVWSAYRLIQRERPRVIHAWNDLPGIIAAFAGLLAGCPRILVHFHHMRAINLSTDRRLIRSYPSCYRRLLERPEIELLFVADATAEDYADWWSVDRGKKFRRLYNGFTDMDATPGAREMLRHRFGIAPEAPVLGTVFRFHKVKQPRLWIDAASRIAGALPEARFIMVGGGDEWDDARLSVASLGLTDRFHFPGQITNVADYLACMDVFMLTSRVEGLPNALVEAQLAGVPVVSTDVGGARETFVPGVTGRLVVTQSPEALAGAATDCLTDRRWHEYAKARSRQMAIGRFGIDRYLASLIKLYGSG